jgi:NAD(P)-dependent dehydrogenase (short-subunit alcohol dehydrogenase family)
MSTPPALTGQVVVVIGGSSGIGRQTACLARDEGADIILTGRDPERLEHAAAELGALSTSAFDATDPAALQRFFTGLPGQIDHVMVTEPLLPLPIARDAAVRMRPGGTLIFMTDTGAGHTGPDMAIAANLAVEIAPVRVNLIAAGVVGPDDVAALAVHLMTNTAVTGATYDIDGGQQFVAG